MKRAVSGIVATGVLLGCHHPHPVVPVQPEPPPPTGVTVRPPVAQPPVAQPPGVAPAPVPATTYHLLVSAPLDDRVVRVAFKPCQPEEAPPVCGASIERVYRIVAPGEVSIAPGDTSFYVKTGNSVDEYDVRSGTRLGARVTWGSAITTSREGRYSFEIAGGDNTGSLAIMDRKALRAVAMVKIGKQVKGIALLSR